jgi:hypothetical protein
MLEFNLVKPDRFNLAPRAAPGQGLLPGLQAGPALNYHGRA